MEVKDIKADSKEWLNRMRHYWKNENGTVELPNGNKAT
jgi:hypothetical protein